MHTKSRAIRVTKRVRFEDDDDDWMLPGIEDLVLGSKTKEADGEAESGDSAGTGG